VHTRFCRSCTFRLFSSVTSTSCARTEMTRQPEAITDSLRQRQRASVLSTSAQYFVTQLLLGGNQPWSLLA
jgi:hypothetical protein